MERSRGSQRNDLRVAESSLPRYILAAGVYRVASLQPKTIYIYGSYL